MPHSHPLIAPSFPISTYRLQFHEQFTFRDALALVDYLARLGVTHVYASPILKARPGSTHGYDIVDHNQINPELGTEEDFEALVDALHARKMGIVLDIVPNHMGVGGKDNAWWLDTLAWGEQSPFARFFDIDFRTHRRGLRGKVMVPVLGDQYGKILQKGELQLKFDAAAGSFSVWYHEHRLPIDPRTYAQIVSDTAGVGDRHRDILQRLREWNEDEPHAAGQKLEHDIAERARNDAEFERCLTRAAAELNGTPGDLNSWMRLHALLEAQSYRPTYYRAAADEINYRRFFNINDLAGIRVELEELFEATHRRVLAWMREGKIDGLRIDHIDGLFDPRQYCERLQARAGDAEKPAYIVVEKILAPHERLPGDWPISGTSGYDTLNLINGVFVDSSAERAMDRIYRHFTRRHASFDRVLRGSKRLIMQAELASEMNVLANEVHRLASADLMHRDFTLRSIRDGLEEVFAHMPVYRSYVTPSGISEADLRHLQWAIGSARRHSRSGDAGVFAFLESVLTGALATTETSLAAEVFRVAMRAQQISGPVTAKGMEDTAFYRYHRLISLNEVGGDPRRFGVSVATFHRANAERLDHWPHDMLAGSTHDTKRGEDARARINVLSELPREWAREVATWMRVNRSRRTELEGADPMPNPSDEYLYYQALVGAWPLDLDSGDEQAMNAFAERMTAFMQKALREGKQSSNWANPNAEYEQAVEQFVRETLRPSATNPFPSQMAKWIGRIARAGAVNSLAQTLLRLTIPGVPDTYRGSELWDTSLVDPDNRRPVDYAVRRKLLAVCEGVARAVRQSTERAPALQELADNWKDGREKLYVIVAALNHRREHPALFQAGSYAPLEAKGELAQHVCGFMRTNGGERAVVVVPRLVARLLDPETGSIDWRDTAVALPAGRYRCLLTGLEVDGGETVPLAQLLARMPVSLLTHA